jgi:sarcosine oxidase, subunit gamma
MTSVSLQVLTGRHRMGCKGPRAAQWLTEQGIALPPAPNSWVSLTSANANAEAAARHDNDALAARLGSSEFFLEGGARSTTLRDLLPWTAAYPAGVYPVLREDTAYLLSGAGVHDVLAQVCNVNFAALPLESKPVVMTMMIGVAVLVIPQVADAGRQYRIWCDPTFGAYVEGALGTIVDECGGVYRGVSA